MLPYASLPDPPDTPTNVSAHDDYESLHDPISPLDPRSDQDHSQSSLHVKLDRSDTLKTTARSTGGTEFFSAVILDIRGHGDREGDEWSDVEEQGEEEDAVVGTLPLRINKRLMRKATLRHRSIISGPVSPRSTILFPIGSLPSLTRNNTTVSTSTSHSSVHPHQSISRLFLEGSPTLPSPIPPIPSKSIARLASMPSLVVPLSESHARSGTQDDIALPSPTARQFLNLPSGPSRSRDHKREPIIPVRSQRLGSATSTGSGQSTYHLNLGRYCDDMIRPGFSPPGSPSPSLHPSNLSPVISYPCSQDRKTIDRSHQALPAGPLTPTRAPSKAAKLLGAYDRMPQKQSSSGVNLLNSVGKTKSHPKKKDHFRPLPTQTLVEIERFFGEVPRKEPKKMEIVHLGSTRHDVGLWKESIGQGAEVGYNDQQGVSWRDMEEEQEFAWLMSDPSISTPSPNPARREKYLDPTPLSGPLAAKQPVSCLTNSQTRDVGPNDSDACTDETSEEEQRYQSTLMMPKWNAPTHPFAIAATSITGGGDTPKKGWAKRKDKKVIRVEESFMDLDFGPDSAKPSKSVVSSSSRANPKPSVTMDKKEWASSTESLILLTPPKTFPSSIPSVSLPALKESNASHASVPVGSDCKTGKSGEEKRLDRSESPPRLKNRPPPLTLRPAKKNPNLPPPEHDSQSSICGLCTSIL